MRFLKHFIWAAALPILAFAALGIFLQPLSGDLTRLGYFAELDWGWNREQPVVPIQPNDGNPQAKVLVIGDSFSANNVWQSVASDRLGTRLLTYNWSDIGPPSCLAGAMKVLKGRHPAARTLVIQTIERHFLKRFADFKPRAGAVCTQDFESSIRASVQPTAARRDLYRNPLPDPLYAMRALVSHFRAIDGTVRSGITVVSPLRRSDLFSNRRSDELLFIDEDLSKNEWRQDGVDQAIRRLKDISALGRTLELTVVFLIVPDKTTAYASYLNDREDLFPRGTFDIWAAAERERIASIDLRREIQARVAAGAIDLYLPDDTHLGSEGYRVVGNLVSDYIERL